jgi:hypothetical protein
LIFFAFEDGHHDFNATLRPSISDQDPLEGCLEVYGEVTFAGISDVAPALAGGEGGVLDVCGEEELGCEG